MTPKNMYVFEVFMSVGKKNATYSYKFLLEAESPKEAIEEFKERTSEHERKGLKRIIIGEVIYNGPRYTKDF